MRRMTVAAALCSLLMLGCGDDAKPITVELQTKVDDLTRRVKTLEDDLLAANKKLINHEQAVQQMHERLRLVETDFDKIKMGTRSAP